MKAGNFAYLRAASAPDAVAAYRACDGEARYLAGGQSLLASMNLRLQTPSLLIDIARIEALRGIEVEETHLRVGALTRHAELLASAEIAREVPLLAAAAPFVAHPAIRNRGTLGGSLALADPAAEFPAVALALGAGIEIHDGTRVREVAAEDFFIDLYETAIAPGEILTAVRFPRARPGQRFAFNELARRRGDFAIVGLAAAAQFEGETVADVRLAFLSVGPTPMRARKAEAALAGRPLDAASIAAARAALAEDLGEVSGDVQTSAETRLHLAGVLLKRQLEALRAGGAA